ncbi:MAG TPA: carboxylate-amine ligase [Vicinamibacteria bacterium]|nr:carboxylate-amine ligase [Vicinamibacteria bacterium]
MADRFTLGIEEEFQLVDPETRALKSHIEEMMAAGAHLGDQLKPELHQSVVEVGTPICGDIREARAAVVSLRRNLISMAEKSGARIVAAGTHPFSHWKDQEITDRVRYKDIVNEMEDLARANLIFGLHVHVGVEDDEMRIQIQNGVRSFLPHLLALSVNSPFWCGRKTGVKSVRSTIFKRFPRTQIPDYFYSWEDYAKYVELLVRTNCIDDGKKIWWDIRPHAYFKTLEFRVCDIPCRAEETVGIAALCQALVAKLHRLFESNLGIRMYPRAILEENKFRALKLGLDGKMIDFGLKQEAPTRALILEVLNFVDDVLDDLGTREEVRFLHAWAASGNTGADRQLRVFQKTGSLPAVVDTLVDETRQGL